MHLFVADWQPELATLSNKHSYGIWPAVGWPLHLRVQSLARLERLGTAAGPVAWPQWRSLLHCRLVPPRYLWQAAGRRLEGCEAVAYLGCLYGAYLCQPVTVVLRASVRGALCVLTGPIDANP